MYHCCLFFFSFFLSLSCSLRRLNIYGYRRIQHGPLKGGYVHKNFIRHRPELSSSITRRSNSHVKVAAASAVAAKVMGMVQITNRGDVRVAPDADPTQLEEVFEEIDYEPINNLAQSVDFGSCNLQAVMDRIFMQGGGEEEANVAKAPPDGSGKLPPHHRRRPSLIRPQAVASAHGLQQIDANHFRTASGLVLDASRVGASVGKEEADMEALFDMLTSNGGPQEEGDADMAGDHPSYESSTSEDADEMESEEQLSERIFPLKLHKMLENATRDGIAHIVSWVPAGGFKVHDSKMFTEQVMPMWFDQTKYESFRRQLNLYNFARISRGPQRGVYSHPSFLPGRRDLLGNITRKINGEVQPPKQQFQQHPPQLEHESQVAPIAYTSAPVASEYHEYPHQRPPHRQSFAGGYPDSSLSNQQQHIAYHHMSEQEQRYSQSAPFDDNKMSY